MTLSVLKDILIRHGIRVSMQRLKILEFLASTKQHPSAEIIYRKLKQSLVSLSKATVYNTLGFLCAEGIVKEVPVRTGEARYDFPRRAHHHFFCTTCGRIIDIPESGCSVSLEGLDGCKITDPEVVVRGSCAACATRVSEQTA